jgi:nucleoside-diphosphate-sugar epimerase
MMDILITGSEGFVGRAFQRYFEQGKHSVVRIDINKTFHAMDARHFFSFNKHQFDLVIHLAAIVGGRATIEGQPMAVATDLAIDSDFFQWALRTKPKRIVYFSSSAAYPTFLQEQAGTQLQERDIDLANIKNPDLTYGWVKLTGEMLANYVRKEGLKISIFRPFSGYGTDQDPAYPFRAFIERGKSKANPFDIWGDGNQTRDFIHIEDVVRATMAGVEADVEVANLCTGRATDFNTLAQMVAAQAGYEPAFRRVQDAPRGVSYRVGDPAYMNTFYTPTISLEEGIARALAGVI